MAQNNKLELFDILSEMEGSSFILEDVANLLSIFDRSITSIMEFVSKYDTTPSKLMHDSLTENYSLLTVIRMQLSSASHQLQTAVRNGYEWNSQNN